MSTRYILIVEDDEAIQHLLARVCARVYPSADVDTTADGAVALLAIGRRLPDLLIADVRMPVLSGIRLVTTLRAQQIAIPIVLISANPEMEAEALAAGATRFLQKPISLTHLQESLVELLPV